MAGKSPLIWENYDGSEYKARKKLYMFIVIAPVVIILLLGVSELIIDEWVYYSIYNINDVKYSNSEFAFIAEPDTKTVIDLYVENDSPFQIKVYFETESGVELLTTETRTLLKGTREFIQIKVNNPTVEQVICRIKTRGDISYE